MCTFTGGVKNIFHRGFFGIYKTLVGLMPCEFDILSLRVDQ